MGQGCDAYFEETLGTNAPDDQACRAISFSVDLPGVKAGYGAEVEVPWRR